jgi:hypothetical protein
MGNIILGFFVIILGVYNIIRWSILKKYGVSRKAEMIGRFPANLGLHGLARLLAGERDGIVIKYSVNDKEYISRIVVSKESDLYGGRIGNVYDVILLENHPKVVAGSKRENYWMTSIISFLCGLFIMFVEKI